MDKAIGMQNRMEQWGKRYHFDNLYEPALTLSKVDLFQAGEIIAGDGYVVGEHKQVCAEISYVVSGSCDFYADGKCLHAIQGDLHVVPAGMRHRIVVGEQNNLRMAYVGFCFRQENDEIDNLIEFYANPPQMLQNDKNFSRTLFEQLLHEIYSARPYSVEAMDACITQILIHIYRIFQYGSEMENRRIVEEARLERIIGHTVFKTLRYIDNNLTSIKSIAQISEDLKYNPDYLSREFRKRTGFTPRQYMEEKRVEVGKTMLREGMSVSETAARLGYASSQSFCKMFSRHEGCSPTFYLKKEREGGNAHTKVEAEENHI